MAYSINKVILVGNLGRDPEVRTFSNGGKVCNFSVATNERWKDKSSGEMRERTGWHNVEVYSEPLIGIIERYLSKGSQVYIEGQLETRKWQDKEGNDRYTTSVTLRPFRGEIVLLGGRGGGARDSSAAAPPPSDAEVNDLDDEIPF